MGGVVSVIMGSLTSFVNFKPSLESLGRAFVCFQALAKLSGKFPLRLGFQALAKLSGKFPLRLGDSQNALTSQVLNNASGIGWPDATTGFHNRPEA